MTLSGAARAAAAQLRAAGIATPELDARILASEAFRLTHAALLANGAARAPSEELARLDEFVARRLGGEPVDRILGRREFWGLDFALTPATLAPRPDTETVVRAALDAAAPGDRALSVLDLGVGSGCLLLAILSERPRAFGIGVDLSPEAAATARDNARALGLAGRASFLVADWTAPLSGRFDLIVSNPPYIPRDDIAALDREVREHDPSLALDGGPDGLDAYSAILRTVPALLAPGGSVVLELGAGQADAVSELAEEAGLEIREVRRDLAGVPRALAAGR